jgi:hypothetical protein
MGAAASKEGAHLAAAPPHLPRPKAMKLSAHSCLPHSRPCCQSTQSLPGSQPWPQLRQQQVQVTPRSPPQGLNPMQAYVRQHSRTPGVWQPVRTLTTSTW